MGDDALKGEADVVGALEELLLRVRVLDEVSAVFGQLGAEVGALVTGEPESSGGDGWIGAADHLELEVGDDAGERSWWRGKEGAGAEAADLLRAKEGEDDGAFGPRAGGEDVGEGEDGGGAGGVVVGAIVDTVAVDRSSGYAEVVEVGGEEDDLGVELGVGAAEDGDGVPGLGAGDALVAGKALLEAVGERRRQWSFLEVGAVGTARLEAEGLELGGGEEGGYVLVAGGGAAAVEVVVGQEGHVGVNFSVE